MSGPSKEQIKNHIRRAADSITPDYAQELWEKPVKKVSADAWFLDGTEPMEKKHYHYAAKWIGLAAACFAVIILGWLHLYRFTDARVYLDVNPGLTLNVNRLGRVIKVTANNEDGRRILNKTDVNNKGIDTAVDTLLTSMVQQGFLSKSQNTLLISVRGQSENRARDLRQKLSVNAEKTLTGLIGSGIILGQNLDVSPSTEEIAAKYGITPGRASLLLHIHEARPSWDMDELAAMSLTDLIRYCQTRGLDISQFLGDQADILGDMDSFYKEDGQQNHNAFDTQDDFEELNNSKDKRNESSSHRDDADDVNDDERNDDSDDDRDQSDDFDDDRDQSDDSDDDRDQSDDPDDSRDQSDDSDDDRDQSDDSDDDRDQSDDSDDDRDQSGDSDDDRDQSDDSDDDRNQGDDSDDDNDDRNNDSDDDD